MPKKTAMAATTSKVQLFKIDYVCNVVVAFITAPVGSTLHILPCGTVSTVYVANQHEYGKQNLP